ncbi:MAG: D-alanine-D-alanine ligase [Planctomycetota bacterium]|jgi:D-alanine-D-alanine ligase
MIPANEVHEPSGGTPSWPSWARLGRKELLAQARNMRIAVLYGGTSSEREVCLISGRAMIEALRQAGDCAPRSVVGIEIGKDGHWQVGPERLSPNQAIESLPTDTIFMIGLHGGEGEGGPIQGFLEISGRAHTGTGVAASALCLDKIRSRQVCARAGIRIAPGVELWPHEIKTDPQEPVQRILALGPGPWFLKPSLGGSSVSMGRAHNERELLEYLERLPALAPGEGLLVEQAIEGVEVTVGMLADEGRGSVCLPVVEIQTRQGKWFDFEEKYSDGGALEFCPPKSLSTAQQEHVQAQAQKAWNALGLSGYARLDFIVPQEGAPVLLEANTLPGFTPRSLFPMAAAVSGLPFNELCVELCLRAWLGHQEALSSDKDQ